jgi:hypothetical protein
MFGKAEPIQKRSQQRNLSHLKGIQSVSLEKKLRNPDISADTDPPKKCIVTAPQKTIPVNIIHK